MLQEKYEANSMMPRAFYMYLQKNGSAGMEEAMAASNNFP